MKNLVAKYFSIKKKSQKGYTLLEYCAGAAVILGLVVGGLTLFRDGVQNYLGRLGQWVDSQALPNTEGGADRN